MTPKSFYVAVSPKRVEMQDVREGRVKKKKNTNQTEYQHRAKLTREKKEKEKEWAEWSEHIYRGCGEGVSRGWGAVSHKVR